MEFDDDNRRRFRPSIGDLSEYGHKYKGKTVSRKKLQQVESEEEQEDDDMSEEDDEEIEDDEDEENEDFEDDEEEEDEIDDDEEENEVKKPKKESSKSNGGVNLIKFDQKEEIEKGKAVKNQLSKLSYSIRQLKY